MSTAGRIDSLVVGATGVVGSSIVAELVRRGEKPLALSRKVHPPGAIRWLIGDLSRPGSLSLPVFRILYCTVDLALLPPALPVMLARDVERVVVFSSSSVVTKIDSVVPKERRRARGLADAEAQVIAACQAKNVSWTILRPTIIYSEGRDQNISRLARLIRRFRMMPLAGSAQGLRQPVHAEDLAFAAVAAAQTPASANKIYFLPGGETLSYSEMIGRLFDGLGLPRRLIRIPFAFWRLALWLAKPLYPIATIGMGVRMSMDLTFDSTPARRDFGFNPRAFHPKFSER
jgi:nucleoside-diphosphate-sugar epimerase